MSEIEKISQEIINLLLIKKLNFKQMGWVLDQCKIDMQLLTPQK